LADVAQAHSTVARPPRRVGVRSQRPAGAPGSRCTGCGVSGDCCRADRVPGAVLACPPMAPDLDLDAASL